MRSLLLVLAILPAACHMPPPPNILDGYRGRGFVNPPTIYEMAQEKCLATMVYGEARGEAKRGQIAVAYTAVNRAKNKSVCQVVLAPKQYSIFNNNPVLRAAASSLHITPVQKNAIDSASWSRAVRVAEMVLRQSVSDPTNGSTHYLAPKVMAAKKYTYPRWSRQYMLVAVIDNHRFFKPHYPNRVVDSAGRSM